MNPANPREQTVTTLDPTAGHMVLINTFTVAPDRTEELLNLLRRATEDTMRHLPGFVSANLHVSLDRRHVANYAQWQNKAHFEAMLQNPEAQFHMQDAAAIAESFHPVLYELRYVENRGGGQ